TSGRSNARRLPLPSASNGTIGLNGLPDCKFTIGEIAHPLTSRSAKACCALNGSEYTPLTTKRRRASKSDSARSNRRFLKFCASGFELPTELVSMDFDNVYEALNVNRLATLRFTLTHMPL